MSSQLKFLLDRLLSSRLIPTDIAQKMGITHPKGAILYGPPGCGKTLIARELCKILQTHPPKIVSGPQLLSKFVGESEANVRALFEDAEKEQRELGAESKLHIIVFDEIDSLCRRRGGAGGDNTGVKDNVVNQILSKIDGIDSLNNVIILGTTNRLELLDEALIRPGRLELQIEIGLPDEAGRLEILKLHTKSLQNNGFIASDVNLVKVAENTKNCTGAELERVVRTARSVAMSRYIDPHNLSNIRIDDLKITVNDFNIAINENKPAFGNKEDVLVEPYGIADFSELSPIIEEATTIVNAFINNNTQHKLVLTIDGQTRGCGATSIASYLAKLTNYPYVRLVNANKLLGLSDSEKISKLQTVFNEATRSNNSVIILDDISSIIELIDDTYSNILRYNSSLVQALKVLITTTTTTTTTTTGKLFILCTHPVNMLFDKSPHTHLQFKLPLVNPSKEFKLEFDIELPVKLVYAIKTLAHSIAKDKTNITLSEWNTAICKLST